MPVAVYICSMPTSCIRLLMQFVWFEPHLQLASSSRVELKSTPCSGHLVTWSGTWCNPRNQLDTVNSEVSFLYDFLIRYAPCPTEAHRVRLIISLDQWFPFVIFSIHWGCNISVLVNPPGHRMIGFIAESDSSPLKFPETKNRKRPWCLLIISETVET